MSAPRPIRHPAILSAAGAAPNPPLAHAALDLEHFLPYRLSVLSNRISQAIARAYAERFAIGITEWRVIAVLGRHPGLSANAVAERTAMDKVAVSRALARLLERDLVQRDTDGVDRRRSVLELSAAGYRIYDEVVPVARGYETRLLAELDDEERVILERALTKLSTAVDGMAVDGTAVDGTLVNGTAVNGMIVAALDDGASEDIDPIATAQALQRRD
jgi:DNA-binding MarR family transcriptional regulator